MAYTIEQPGATGYTIEPPDNAPASPPPDKSKPKGLLTDLERSFTDVPREMVKETGEAWNQYTGDLKRKGGLETEAPSASGLGRTALDMAGVLGAPVAGAFTSVVGRPVETVTGGKVKRRDVGNVASLAAPFLGEAEEAVSLSRAAREMGLSRQAAKVVLANKSKLPVAPKRPELAANVRSLEALKIDPSLAVASTNRGTRGLTNALGGNWLAGAPVRAAVGRTAKGFKAGLDEAVNDRGGPVSAAEAGGRIKTGLERFAKSSPVVRQIVGGSSPEVKIAGGGAARSIPSRVLGFGNKADNLYSRADAMIGPSGQPIALSHTQAALGDVMQEFHDPHLRDLFQNSKLKSIFDAIEKGDGKMTWNDATALRTKIRETLKADPALRHTVSDAQVDGIYSALTKDLQEGAGQLGGPKARRAYEQANQFYRTGMDRINNTLSRYYGPQANEERVFHDLLASAQSGGSQNLARLKQVKQSLSPEEWQSFSASVLDHMGHALPGAATKENDFSFSTFLTNFNRLDQRASKDSRAADTGLKVLFDGAHGSEGSRMVDDLAKVASEMKELHKLHNYSRSGEVAGNVMTLSGLSALGPHHPLAAVLGVLTGNAATKLLESPSFVRWLASVPADGGPALTAQKLRELSRHAADVGAISATSRLLNPAPVSQDQPAQ